MLLATILLLLSGCGADGPASWFDTYIDRMARVLDVDARGAPAVARLPFPVRRELRLERAQVSIDLLDFLALQDCGLQEVVARRNSALGKVAPASSRLVFDLEFLRLAPACLENLSGEAEAELHEAVATAAAQKRAALPAAIWQALLGGAEYREFWSTPMAMSDYPQAANLPVDEVLRKLLGSVDRWLGGDYTVDRQQLEVRLQRLASGDGGALLAAFELQARQLRQLDGMLVERFEAAPLCPGAASARAEPLRNVVTRFFIGAIQAWSARLNARQLELMPLVQRLEARLASGEPGAFRQWRMQRDDLLTRWAQAP